MRIYYTIHQALDYLKDRIEQEEKTLEKAKQKYDKIHIERIIEWYFERGLNILRYAKPGEVSPDTIDWFLGRKKNRPDTEKLKERLKQEEEEEQNKKD